MTNLPKYVAVMYEPLHNNLFFWLNAELYTSSVEQSLSDNVDRIRIYF